MEPPSKNKILLALMASQEELGVFLRPEEVIIARGDLSAGVKDIRIVESMLSGVNIGLYYAYMFGVPSKITIDDAEREYRAKTQLIKERALESLQIADNARWILDDSDDSESTGATNE